jgi:predicted RND superfamily exporter protein
MQLRPPDSSVRRTYESITGRPKSVLLLAVPASFLSRLTIDSRIEAFIPADHPSMLAREEVKHVFGLGDRIAIAIVDETAAI